MKTKEQKEASRQASARWRKNHPEKAKQVSRDGAAKWRLQNPEVSKSQSNTINLRRRYGLTPEQYEKKLKSQNDVCSLCEKPFDLSRRGTSPALDHCHASKRLRDFIHHRCNVALGLLQDNPELCRKAAAYLEKHK